MSRTQGEDMSQMRDRGSRGRCHQEPPGVEGRGLGSGRAKAREELEVGLWVRMWGYYIWARLLPM